MKLADMVDGPVELVTFDLYETLIEVTPPGWQVYQQIFGESDFPVEEAAAKDVSRVADDYFTVENGRWPLRDRTDEERQAFDIARWGQIQQHLNLDVDETQLVAWHNRFKEIRARQGENRWTVVAGVLETMNLLQSFGVKRVVISNADADVTEYCHALGFGHAMDGIVTSAVIGWEKPDPRPFLAALELAGVDANRSVHVGDQPLSDIVGARGVGMGAVLLDAHDRHTDGDSDAVRIGRLFDIVGLVSDHNLRVALG